MNNDQKFWMRLWTLVLVGVLGIALSIAVPVMYADSKISEAIKNGANPVEAKYALRITTRNEDTLAWISKKK